MDIMDFMDFMDSGVDRRHYQFSNPALRNPAGRDGILDILPQAVHSNFRLLFPGFILTPSLKLFL